MARMPGVRWAGEKSPKTKMSRYDVLCLHTIVGRAPAHAAHFSTAGDGTITQSRDTKYRSAANLEGNHRVIAIENEDMGPDFPNWGGDGTKVPAFTEAQIEAIVRIYAWAHKTHGIPLQLCPDSRPGSKGLAYHRQGVTGNFGTKTHPYPGRVAGGELWSGSRGKVCPGEKRIAQMPEILERTKKLVALQSGAAVTPSKEPVVNSVSRPKGANDVQFARHLVTVAISLCQGARLNGKPRPAVRAMGAAFKAALGIGPKS